MLRRCGDAGPNGVPAYPLQRGEFVLVLTQERGESRDLLFQELLCVRLRQAINLLQHALALLALLVALLGGLGREGFLSVEEELDDERRPQLRFLLRVLERLKEPVTSLLDELGKVGVVGVKDNVR